jgi:soluble lytic murein transglycosylase-like protein
MRLLISAVVSLLMVMCNSPMAFAQVYTYKNDQGITVFTNTKPDANKYKVKNHGCFGVCRVGVNWRRTPLKPDLYRHEVMQAAAQHGVDPHLIRAIMHAESWFEVDALSSAGAQGLMQLMPATQTRFNVDDAYNPTQNINAGSAYLAWLIKEFDQDLERVIAAYNSGENAVKRYDGVPPFAETQEYLRRVSILHKRYQNQFYKR